MGDARHVDGGVTSAAEARLAEAGLIAPLGPGALDVRTGVMAGPGSTAVVTGTSTTGTMTVQINPHVAVTTRGSANGVYLGPVLTAATTVNIAAAPGTGSRIDVVYVKQQDSTSGVPSPDVTTAPLYGVLQGTAGSSPTKPNLATIVGAEELATVQVAAGATSTNGAGVTITQTARQTVARGGIIPVANATERLALSSGGGAYDGLVVVERPTDRLYEWTGTAWQYVGGAPPPTALAGLGGGFSAVSGHIPVVFKDASGMVAVSGWIANVSTFSPTTNVCLTLPAGYLPASKKVFQVPYIGAAVGYVIVTVATTGNITIDQPGTTSIASGSNFFLDNIRFHPTDPGTGALA